jgi:hypothetical protein
VPERHLADRNSLERVLALRFRKIPPGNAFNRLKAATYLNNHQNDNRHNREIGRPPRQNPHKTA